MSVAHTSRIRIEKHQGPHRTAHFGDFDENSEEKTGGRGKGLGHLFEELPGLSNPSRGVSTVPGPWK